MRKIQWEFATQEKFSSCAQVKSTISKVISRSWTETFSQKFHKYFPLFTIFLYKVNTEKDWKQSRTWLIASKLLELSSRWMSVLSYIEYDPFENTHKLKNFFFFLNSKRAMTY